jgi:1-acyl-sn-glycerol-3-phosphate acyltransferase
MRLIHKLVGFLKGLLAAVMLLSSLLVINFLQCSSLLIKPFSQNLFRKFNRACANTWWGWCDLWAEKLYGIEICLTGDEVPSQENAIVVLNHQMMVDIPVVFRLAQAKQRLGDLKWFVKDVLKYLPGIGWGMLFLDCLYVKRDWLTDKDYIFKTFQNINRNKIPVWLMTFAEGTRFTPKKRDQSQKFALERGLKPLKHVLIPRTKGFVVSVQSLRNHVTAVYDLTIGYIDKPLPTVWQWFKGDVKKVHLHVRRFAIETLPTDEKLLADWLNDLFVQKDQLMARFYETGSFKI